MHLILRAAGIYNMLWGTFAIVAPVASLRLHAMPTSDIVQPVWQGLGLVLGLFGLGYWLSARDPYRHWVVIFIGLLSKVIGPIGLCGSFLQGTLPAQGLCMTPTNDLIWWVPFAIILWRAAVWHDDQLGRLPADGESALRTLLGSTGKSLQQLSEESRMLVVFLRHSGCTFCREALADLAASRSKIEAAGTRIALVHMSPESDIAPFVQKYHVADLPRFSDPARQLYREFDLSAGSPTQLLGPKVMWRGMLAAFQGGHGFGGAKDSVFQMPGTFLIEDGKILQAFRHQTAADRPDYAQLACPMPTTP